MSQHALSRRGFVGGVATTLGYLTFKPSTDLLAQAAGAAQQGNETDEYDAFAKLANNENPYGPSDSVLKAMTHAFKYANRYGYPDGGIVDEIAKHHGVKRENIMLGAGSGEILDVSCSALLLGGKKIVGSDPSYSILYSQASGLKSETIRIPLLPDFRQDIAAMVKATKANYRDVGFVYLCNPNNPTGRIVTKQEVKQLLDELPLDMPVLIDEAYHHFVEDPAYATSIPYVLEGRPVIVTRTFSKISGLAGMRLGYAVAPREIVQRMRPWSTGSVNAVVRWGGVAALKDVESMARVKRLTIELRNKATNDLKALGYSSIPSEGNFFMVHLRRPVQPVIAEFRKKGVLVGRPFPPLTDYLRVSVGTAEEMGRFMTAVKQIMTAG
ncbi:MAG: aminotransferase class I/II-fold pyridoxal phosphate-dependent enzyme [Gemmatimonadaceae bacterium]